VGVISVLGLLLFYLRFCGVQSVPPLPPVPEITIDDARELAGQIGERTDVYWQQIETDSRRFDLDAELTRKAISQIFPHRTDRNGYRLQPGDSIEVLGLRISLGLRQIDRRKKQMELRIDNRTNVPLAYRIVTRPSKGTIPCGRKIVRNHNAIAIAPDAIETRSECVYRPGWDLEIGKIEVIEIPELSVFYLSAMSPTELGLSNRTSAGHTPPVGVRHCTSVLPARVKRAQERGEILWRDVVDFYARHSCSQYRFPYGYRAFADGSPKTLPAAGSVQ